MKYLTLIAALLFAPPAFAEEEDGCKVLGDLAHLVMERRQERVPMSDMMAIAADNDFIRQVVIEAYDRPAMNVAENQREMASNFRNDIEAICYGAQK